MLCIPVSCMCATKLHGYDLDLLNTAVAVVLLIPFFAEQAASQAPHQSSS